MKKPAKKNNTAAKLKFLRLFFIAALLALAARTGYWALEADYTVAAVEAQINKGDAVIKPIRGSVLDRYKRPLAISEKRYTVILDVPLLKALDKTAKKNAEAPSAYAFRVAGEFFQIPAGEIQKKYDAPENAANKNVVLKENADEKTWLAWQTRLEEMENNGEQLPRYIFGKETSYRVYPNGVLAARLTGFIRNEEFYGLEKFYNDQLTGEEGRFNRYSSDLLESSSVPAAPGKNLITTIDIKIQQITENVLKEIGETLKPQDAGAIVMNPQNGEILAYAQYPFFDPNFPNDLERYEDFSKTAESAIDDASVANYRINMWKDANIQNTFEPGSIYKPIVVAAALEEGVVTLDSQFYCPGYKIIGKEKIPCSKTEGHGTQNLTEALANSCNPAMIDIIFALGSEKYSKYQKEFGFGEKPAIDLPNESAGILHTEAELRQPMYLATNSIGQGFNVNAVQMASAFSAVVNGGRMFRPRVVKEIEDRSKVVAEFEPELTNKVISKETSYILRRALLKVIEEGTGRGAQIEGAALGGKTGTAQQGNRAEENLVHSFIGYYLSPEKPDAPEILVIVTINRPSVETENPSAAPYFKKIMSGILGEESFY